MYTSGEIEAQIGISSGQMYQWARNHGIENKVITKDGHRVALWTDEAFETFKTLAENKKKGIVEGVAHKVPIWQKEKHPLVTDERCFDLYWFPDPIPKCFKED
jgi:hypothetical protein